MIVTIRFRDYSVFQSKPFQEYDLGKVITLASYGNSPKFTRLKFVLKRSDIKVLIRIVHLVNRSEHLSHGKGLDFLQVVGQFTKMWSAFFEPLPVSSQVLVPYSTLPGIRFHVVCDIYLEFLPVHFLEASFWAYSRIASCPILQYLFRFFFLLKIFTGFHTLEICAEALVVKRFETHCTLCELAAADSQ